MKSRLFPALFAVVGLLLAGCFPESKNPLSSPATSRIDARIAGVYEQKKESEKQDSAYWHFHYRGAAAGQDQKPRVTTTIEIIGVSHPAESGLDGARYHAFATRLGGHDYLSFVEQKGGSAKKENYSFARYELNWRGDLHLWLLDTNSVAAAIKSGKLRGKVRTNQFGTDVLLTDTTANLAAFVAASDPAKLFGKKPMVFRRLAR